MAMWLSLGRIGRAGRGDRDRNCLDWLFGIDASEEKGAAQNDDEEDEQYPDRSRHAVPLISNFDLSPFAPIPHAVYSPFTMTTDAAPLAIEGGYKPDRPIALIGMMGSGKSTIGKRLAVALDIPFVDSDQAIEDAAGCTIPEIFAQYGETEFRDGERRVIQRLVDGQPKVIATGGGAFIQPETRQLLLDKALVIWLDAEIDTLVERVSRRGGRPLLDGKDPREVLERLLAERNPIYAKAHIRIPSKPVPHEASVRSILEVLKQQ